jgi:DnaJ-class molecular chaperone
MPEPSPPLRLAGIDCPDCNGCGVVYDRQLERLGLLYPECKACNGKGVRMPELQPAA